MEDIKPGFYLKSNEDYHAGPGVSKSFLWRLFSQSPAHARVPVEETPAMILGAAAHVGILEPNRFSDLYYAFPPEADFRKKEWKELKATKEERSVKILKHEDMVRIEGMRDAVRAHPEATRLLSSGEPELSCYWYDPIHTSVLCKARFDWINKSERVIVELKTTTDARPHKFVRIAYDLGYHFQSFQYSYGCTHATMIEHKDFFFIVVEKEPPHGVMVYKADEDFINEGGKAYNQAIDIYVKCLKEDRWPCYPTEPVPLGLPGWLKRKNETENVIYD